MYSAPTARSGRATTMVPVLFTATIFLSASLLFFVQPLFARIVLPHIGGAPAVWTTAMLFFQTVLIGGYLYAHLSTQYLSQRSQVAVHLLLWAAALTFLPLAVAEGWRYDANAPAAGQTLVLFLAGVGLPFAVLSANAPLIQAWYARTDGPSAEDPYFLYGASNLGSMVALLAFPLAAEPLFGVSRIGFGWAAGFVLLGGFLALCGLAARPGPPVHAERAGMGAAPQWRQMAVWAGLAFVPSSMMLAVTTKVSVDVGAIPLLWVVPLALYLASFVLTFTNRPMLGPRTLRAGFALAIVVLVLAFSGMAESYLSIWTVGLMFAAFFALALFAHRKLYESRPDNARLTLFYVTMSVGGALGGLFNSILAPALFTGLWEGPVTLLASAFLLVSVRSTGVSRKPPPIRRATVAVLTGGAVLAGGLAVAKLGAGNGALLRDRSFFGTHEVLDFGQFRVYRNGTTLHGAQRLADLGADRPEPLLYYHRNGPMAQVLTSEIGRNAERVGIVGLGVGALACYRQPGQAWHFYEIDATVAQVARDPSLFTFLAACAPDEPVHMGDARVVLAGQEDLRFDILVIDAYSSDSVPQHLTTTEAMALYRDRLAPGGVLVYHISNNYFAIDRPLARSAAALDLAARKKVYRGNRAEDPTDPGSVVVVVARDDTDFGSLSAETPWKELQHDGGRLWTDDYTNLLSILR